MPGSFWVLAVWMAASTSGGTTAGLVSCARIAATGATNAMAAMAATHAQPRPGARRLTRESRIASSRPSSSARRAIATAAPVFPLLYCNILATSKRCPAYSGAGSPAARTRSSAARSPSFNNCRQALHASGFHQNSANAARASRCAAASPRSTCANSCNTTTRRRSALHSSESAGRNRAGRHTPKASGMEPAGSSHTSTRCRMPRARAICRQKSGAGHRGALRRVRHIRA